MGKGTMKDWRLLFKGSQTGSYATIERMRGYTVPVLLWQISKADEGRLDIYEGFPDFYYKQRVTRSGSLALQRLDIMMCWNGPMRRSVLTCKSCRMPMQSAGMATH